jgi:hypothetical protein
MIKKTTVNNIKTNEHLSNGEVHAGGSTSAPGTPDKLSPLNTPPVTVDLRFVLHSPMKDTCIACCTQFFVKGIKRSVLLQTFGYNSGKRLNKRLDHVYTYSVARIINICKIEKLKKCPKRSDKSDP